MGAYEDNLRHIAEPAAPSEREKAESMTVEDYEALWLADVLRDYAHYEADDPYSGIAVGLASYLDTKVRDEGASYVTIYVHTDEAVLTLDKAFAYCAREDMKGKHPFDSIGVASAELRTPENEPEVVDLNGEQTVAYDRDDAARSLADKQIAEAEDEYLAEVEAEAEKRGINNRKTPRVNPRWD